MPDVTLAEVCFVKESCTLAIVKNEIYDSLLLDLNFDLNFSVLLVPCRFQ